VNSIAYIINIALIPSNVAKHFKCHEFLGKNLIYVKKNPIEILKKSDFFIFIFF